MNVLSKTRILVVEDEAFTALDLERSLTQLGYDVVGLAANGDTALALAHQESPELVLMDITLAGREDGVAVAARLGLPVIFLTAHSDAETVGRAVATNPYGYLVKPFRPADLHCAVEVALQRHRAEAQVRDDLVQAARLDPLTGLLNRRGFDERLQQLLIEGRRGRKFVLALADIDHFKSVNDTEGHLFGDDVLVGFAAAVRAQLREQDCAARLGGDEFCLLLVDCDEADASRALDRARRAFADLLPGRGLSASFGACRNTGDDDAKTLLARADQALYRAKAHGRNRLEMEGL